jgi:hypothetical protein
MTDYIDEQDEEEHAPPAELRALQKRTRRWRSIKETVFEIVWVGLAILPWWFGFGRTDMIAWYFGLFIVWQVERLRRHVRAIHHRLAWMHDDMDRSTGRNDRTVAPGPGRLAMYRHSVVLTSVALFAVGQHSFVVTLCTGHWLSSIR